MIVPYIGAGVAFLNTNIGIGRPATAITVIGKGESQPLVQTACASRRTAASRSSSSEPGQQTKQKARPGAPFLAFLGCVPIASKICTQRVPETAVQLRSRASPASFP